MTESSRRPEGGTRRLQEMSHGYKQAGILIGAIELDLFTAVSEGAREVAQIAQRTGLSQWAAQKIVHACAALQLLERREGLYYNAPDVEKYLVRGKPNYRGIWMTLGKGSFAMWSEVAAILRGDKPPASPGFYYEAWKDEGIAHLMNQATFNIGLGSGYGLARSLDLSRYSLLLDLAGGSGCYGILMIGAILAKTGERSDSERCFFCYGSAPDLHRKLQPRAAPGVPL